MRLCEAIASSVPRAGSTNICETKLAIGLSIDNWRIYQFWCRHGLPRFLTGQVRFTRCIPTRACFSTRNLRGLAGSIDAA
jgi:hypothetical protein